MHLDVSQLKGFYGSAQGRIVRQIIAQEIRSLWPSAEGERVVGLGYASPFLAAYLGHCERLLVLMPAAGGVAHWPREGPNATGLAYEDALPLPDNAVDKLLVVHLLETTRDPQAVLREVWRVLVPTGRVLAVVPYRSGAWARADATPLGRGRPFSRAQLGQLMESAWLEPTEMRRFLFVPPSRRRSVLASAAAFERLGRRLAPRFAGLLAVEGQKTLVRSVPAHRPPRGLRVLVPDLAPVPKPAARAATGAAISDAAGTPPAPQGDSRTTTGR